MSHKATMVQTSDIVWCNTKSAGIKLSHWKFFQTNLNQENEFIMDQYHAPVACLICHLEPGARFIASLDHSLTYFLWPWYAERTTQLWQGAGKMTVTAIFRPHYRSHRKHPLPFASLASIRTEKRQDFPFKQNKWMSSLNKESEMAWWCPDPNQAQPWASCPRWSCAELRGGLDDLQSPSNPSHSVLLWCIIWPLSPVLGKLVSLLHDSFKHPAKIPIY